MSEISDQLTMYISDYFQGIAYVNFSQDLFEESYSLSLSEVQNLIPKDYLNQFKPDASFNCASGCLEFEALQEEAEECEYNVLLLTNEDYSKALLLCLQKIDASKDEAQIIILKDFLRS